MFNFFLLKRNLLIFLVFFTIIFISSLIIVIGRKNKTPLPQKQILSPAPTITPIIIEKKSRFPSPSITQFIPSVLIPTFTGVKEEEVPKEKLTISQQYLDLKKRLPVITDDFKIDYDFNEAKFIVVFKKPFETAQSKFYQWLIENGFDKIPKEDFDFR